MAVVIATRDRSSELLATLDRLEALPERPPIVVVDNASADGTAAAVRAAHPDVELIALPKNLGGGARTVAAKRLTTPYVAFADDDSWWAPGALERAASLLDRHPRLGLVAARVLVGEEQQEDPVCAQMAASSVPAPFELPGPAVLGFIACGAIVRRSAFLQVGGFDSRFGIGGEEELLALDLAAAGWGLCYAADVVAHHHPSASRDPAARRRRQLRNALWSTWLRSPLPDAARRTLRLLAERRREPAARGALLDALRALPWVLTERRVVPAHVRRALRALDQQSRSRSASPDGADGRSR